ncbi:Renalase [Tepidimonas alkaliphilus]|uniref:Renalase n=1 Tax=Tepidimonas alkaliphilus TaxID=2588942 RepID=A0A554W4M8_9BURK|nr:FAD-dependent oxidoreductase [Tepidimonas alkaliphilus]TSE18532.1 Renalase [Tepidimonas alkaliphilus]
MPRSTSPPSHLPRPQRRRPRPAEAPSAAARAARVAVVGAGMAGLTAARTLARAGLEVTLLDKSRGPGGRMATRHTEAGRFDHGAQFFTVRDARFERALQATQAPVAPWRATFVRVLSADGRLTGALPPDGETRWVPVPGMNALPKAWVAQWLADHPGARAHWNAPVQALRRERDGWRLQLADGDGTTPAPAGPFDAVLLALPHPQALALLTASALAADWQARLREEVAVAPCWTLMAAWPHRAGPLGPAWDAARCLHPRLAWVAREPSKPQRGGPERWVAQASPAWSAEHLEDDAARVADQLRRALAEVTGIRAEPALAVAHRWRYAQTQRSLGEPFLWDASAGLGVCGDWCLGHRVEHAFLSGLELALAVAAAR